jgi:carboxyl-terminal processing protease
MPQIAQNRGAGQNQGSPDVCKSPQPPVPYMNVALNALAVNFCANILLSMLPAFNIATKIPVTQGDDPGVGGPGPKRVGEFVTGSPKVFFNMLPAIRVTSQTTGNAKNVGGTAAVPSATNVFLI